MRSRIRGKIGYLDNRPVTFQLSADLAAGPVLFPVSRTVNRTLRCCVWPLPGLLTAVLLALPGLAAPPAIPIATDADDRTPVATAPARPLTPEEKQKQLAELQARIAELQKQLADTQKKVEELKAAPTAAAEPAGLLPGSLVGKLNWRAIGPANMGGRITALAVVESDPGTYYVATASGGLLKTINNGTTFAHAFDHEATVSIGDVVVSQTNPNIVWLGTGESNPRNSVSYGDGVYKSTDAGKTWTHMGLRRSFAIGKILIHPKDPNTVYVGAMGRVYGPNEERGLFKTTDGGKTWAKILYVDYRTGVIDMRMDPFNPETLLVGMWERQRDEFDTFFTKPTDWPAHDQYGPVVNYGAGGGLFKSTDGGKKWKRLTDEKLKTGLPTVKTGRIGLDYSTKTKGLVFAIIDAEKIGTGRPVLTVTIGLAPDDAKGGVKVAAVLQDGPAGKAGIREGDVITSIDGTKIPDSDAFTNFLVTKKPGEVVKVTLRRGDKDVVVEVKLAQREVKAKESDPKKGPGPKGGPPPVLGVIIKTAESGGVEVEDVTPNGPAATAGIEKEDIITAVAGKKVTDQQSLRAVLSGFTRGDKVKVTVLRAKKSREVEVTLGGGGRGRAPRDPNYPYLINPQVGGQQPNIQGQQGKDGYQTGGVYMSKDGGDTWTRVNSLNPRPFYFSQVRVDPTDDNVIYVLGDTSLWKSVDGGKKFAAGPARGVHPDHHALWINPKNAQHMLIGCDGGFYVTFDRGQNWDHLNILALGQFYHVACDNRKPYRVYGGLQDNGSWGGPSHVLRSTGPVNDDWLFLQGGDGFVCRVDPTDPDIVYSESQNGGIQRRNLRTGERGGFNPKPPKEGERLRFNWNTPFILSHHNSSIVYAGAQYVFRSIQRGADAKAVSPELTRTKVGTITAIEESPRSADVLWAGTDDGNVWVTRDGGAKWENVFEKLKAAGLPGPRWVATLEPSRVKDGRCYVCLDAHRSDDDRPYLFVTDDYGQTWKPITANLPAFGSTRVLREDRTNADLLYAGTEFGIWASVNRGGSWTKVNNNLPTVAVHEVAQPTTASEIVVATHGRSLWVLDVASLRQVPARTEKVDGETKTVDPLKDRATLFTPATAVRWKLEAGRESPYSMNIRKFYGTNPDRRAHLEYLLTAPAKDVTLKVVDVIGRTVREFRSAPSAAGFHRFAWDLTRAGTGGGAALVPAGEYRVVLTADGKVYSARVVVENDPNADPKAVITLESERRSRDEEEEEEEEED